MEDKKAFVVWTEIYHEGVYKPSRFMRVCVGEVAKEKYIFELRVKMKKWEEGNGEFVGNLIDSIEVPMLGVEL